MTALTPTLSLELALWRAGYRVVVGIDEVGRGPLAGPVVVGAVALPPFLDAAWLPLVRDSKDLTAARREALNSLIRRDALAVAVGARSACEIDALGLVPATRAAALDALAALKLTPDFLLLDAFPLREVETDQTALIKGDARCISIGCASIVAKVARDRMLSDYDRCFPGYGFAAHKGYGTAAHLAALDRLGVCPLHRRSFAPVQARERRVFTTEARRMHRGPQRTIESPRSLA